MPIPILEMLEFHSFFREELEELFTFPNLPITGEDAQAMLANLDGGKKLPKNFKLADNLLRRLGQNFGFTPDQIEELRNHYLG